LRSESNNDPREASGKLDGTEYTLILLKGDLGKDNKTGKARTPTLSYAVHEV